ncbi:MAG: hypothetical protein CL897_04805 [Dehalococcoidia bacterium]|nr:hypothetical protein [Dehalococcoidia bacterium]|tara:strand:- start:340 stop:1281 length:942 start_codon:yes stop_codon:yes gene_type:complete
MAVVLGNGDFQYEVVPNWEQLPEGVTLRETPGVAVNARDEVFLLTRNTDYPVMVFDRTGSFLRSFGRGVFDARTHGMFIGADEAVWCVDDGTHSITKWSQEGELLQTLGGDPSPLWSGEPFNRPTHAAVSPKSGDLFVTDGYGNASVHRYSADGEHVLSWGGPGIDPGQFIRPHNVAIDEEERVYVADRECHRVQVFDTEGNFLEMWNNIHRPDGMVIGPDGNVYIGELNGMDGMEGCPGLGHRVSILTRGGDLLARFGDEQEGEEPGQFIAPHGVAVDSQGDIYVGEVSFSIRGRTLDPPRELKSLTKLRKL